LENNPQDEAKVQPYRAKTPQYKINSNEKYLTQEWSEPNTLIIDYPTQSMKYGGHPGEYK